MNNPIIKASGAIPAYACVKVSSTTNTVEVCTVSTDTVFGVTAGTPATNGNPVEFQTSDSQLDIVTLRAGDVIAVGDQLVPDTTGAVVTSASGQFIAMSTATSGQNLTAYKKKVGDGGLNIVGQFLRDAISGTDSVDILIAGDSNTNKDGWGWCDGLNFALQQRNAVDYATPIVPVFSRESANFYGVNSFFNSFGYINDTVINTPAGTTGSTVNLQIGSAANSPELYALLSRSSGLFQPNAAPFNYGYIPTGTWCDWNGGISLYHEASPYPVISWLSSELRYRVVYGAGPGMGTLRLTARLDGAPYSAIGTTVVTNCNQATWEWKVATKTVTAATRTAASKFGYADITADATASITGPMALALQSVSRPIKGFAVQSMCHYGGANMDTVSADAAGAALVIKAYMKEARERQISCTGSGRVIVMIQGGLNTGVNPWATSATSFMQTCQTQWLALGYPISDIGFAGLVSYQDDTPDSDAADRTSAATLINIYNIYDGKNLASYAELLAGDSVGTYFADASTERNHLNEAGYKFICGRFVSALLSY